MKKRPVPLSRPGVYAALLSRADAEAYMGPMASCEFIESVLGPAMENLSENILQDCHQSSPVRTNFPYFLCNASMYRCRFPVHTTYNIAKLVILLINGPLKFQRGWKGESLYAMVAKVIEVMCQKIAEVARLQEAKRSALSTKWWVSMIAKKRVPSRKSATSPLNTFLCRKIVES